MNSPRDTAEAVGFPIRKSPDQSLLAAPRSLSQRATSFIASQCQGIHQTPFSYLILQIRRTQRATRGRAPVRRDPQRCVYPGTGHSRCETLDRKTTGFSKTDSRCSRTDAAGKRSLPRTRKPVPRFGSPGIRLVEVNGLEPMTPCLQSRCSPAELHPLRAAPLKSDGGPG